MTSNLSSRSSKLLALFLFWAVGYSAHGATEYVGLFSVVGSGYWSQSLRASRHFYKADPLRDNPYWAKRLDNPEDPLYWEFQRRKPEPSNLRWNLGYTLSHLTTDATGPVAESSDLSHDISLGMGWEILPILDLSWGASGGTTPTQDYRNGQVYFSLSLWVPLRDLTDWIGGVGKGSSLEEEERQRKAEKRKALEEDRKKYSRLFNANQLGSARENFSFDLTPPTLLLNWGMGITRHIKLPSTSTDSTTTVDQRRLTVEGLFYPTEKWGIGFGSTFYSYSQGISSTLTSLASGFTADSHRLYTMNLLNQMPDLRLSGYTDYVFDENWDCRLSGSYNTYVVDADPYYVVTPELGRRFGKNWYGSAGAEIQTGGGSTAYSGVFTLAWYL